MMLLDVARFFTRDGKRLAVRIDKVEAILELDQGTQIVTDSDTYVVNEDWEHVTGEIWPEVPGE